MTGFKNVGAGLACKSIANYMNKTLILKLVKVSKNNSGFTLLELLVSIIIIGVLASIALPSLLGQTNRAKQTEAKLNLSSLNKAQQVFYLENNEFVSNVAEIGKLGIGIVPESANYSITFANPAEGAGVVMIANAKGEAFKSYAAGIGLAYQGGASEPATLTVLCESTELGQELDSSAIAISSGVAGAGGGEVTCSGGTVAAK